MIPVDGSRQLHAAIPGSRLIEIEDEGHMDWFADPTRLIDLTRAFIDAPDATV
ncbi:alpha/beta fold hydrolase [Nonomuraea recticatena]